MMQSTRCSGCDYKRDVYFSDRVYDVGNLKFGLPVLANLGWCFTCRQCVAVEYIPDLTQLIEELADLRRNTECWQEENDSPNNRLVWAESRLQWRLRRKSPARCLECGSTDIRELSNYHKSLDGNTLGEHPNCLGGGKLLLDGTAFVNYLGLTVYVAEGLQKNVDATELG